VEEAKGTKAEEELDEETDCIPMSFALVNATQRQGVERPLLCLFDSGSAPAWINRKILPPGVGGETVDSVAGSTMAGAFTSNQQVSFGELMPPELHRSRRTE